MSIRPNMRSSLLLVCVFLNLYGVLSYKLLFKPHEQVDLSNHWAFLVAGSDGWSNYRHQADVSHAYQILRGHGMPAERIIVMMVDDIAHNEDNPYPGTIINAPHGQDVYSGVVIDYKGKDVNAKNFLAVLAGNESAVAGIGSGKVIKSGPSDHVFVNFVDHGGPLELCFPTTSLYAADLVSTLETMARQKQFGQMVMYIEACYSGSMFSNLPHNINVYAATAANELESSYACYYDSDRDTFLADLFSANWMSDSEQGKFNLETLKAQYETVRQLTNMSHVMQYGDKGITVETIGEFQGQNSQVHGRVADGNIQQIPKDLVASEDVPLAIMYYRLQSAKDAEEEIEIRHKIRALLNERDMIEKMMRNIVHRVSAKTNMDAEMLFGARRVPKSHDCYKYASQTYNKHCYNSNRNGYAKKSLWMLVNMCEENIDSEVIVEAITKECLVYN